MKESLGNVGKKGNNMKSEISLGKLLGKCSKHLRDCSFFARGT